MVREGDDLIRLQAAISTIHNHLHAGEINKAHEACECAMAGSAVRQPNLTLTDTARAQVFANAFVELCKRYDVEASYMAAFPSATIPGYSSLQVGGSVRICKLIERGMGTESKYQGDHVDHGSAKTAG